MTIRKQDVLSLRTATGDLVDDPSATNAVFFAWDAIAVVAPFVPGSWAGKGAKAAAKTSKIKIVNKANGFKNVEVHHIIEKRLRVHFDKIAAKAGDMLSVPLDKALHREITTRWRTADCN